MQYKLPVKNWHELIEDSTIADAILDRLVHNAYRFELKGPTRRRIATHDNQACPDKEEVIPSAAEAPEL